MKQGFHVAIIVPGIQFSNYTELGMDSMQKVDETYL